MRINTCTPISFEGNTRFFTRDSGAFSRALNGIGVKSIAMMPEPRKADDERCLMRVPYRELESPEFWRGLNLDGLVLYSWAARKYIPIAKAVHNAGIPFLVSLDNSGLVSKLANPRLWKRDSLRYHFHPTASLREAAYFLWYLLENSGIHLTARARLKTYEYATRACAVTPLAVQWLKAEALYFGRYELAEKICYLPHPQQQLFTYTGTPKERLVVSVGRWEESDGNVKSPVDLIKAFDVFLSTARHWRACVIGSGSSTLLSRLKLKGLKAVDRIDTIEFLKPSELRRWLNVASIACWASKSEGQIGSGAQALCCGCSVVAGNAGTLSCFHHYVSRESGRLALSMDAESLAEALILEAQAWDSGQRDPERISRIWSGEFHGQNVAKAAIRYLNLSQQSKPNG